MAAPVKRVVLGVKAISIALVVVLSGCGATPSPPSKPAAQAAAGDKDARGVTLKTARGEVQALVLADKALPGQFVAAFTPGLREDVTDAAQSLAAVIGTSTGKAPAPQLQFYTTSQDRFYLGEGADRYCVQIVRETENGGIVSMRFARASEAKKPTTVAQR